MWHFKLKFCPEGSLDLVLCFSKWASQTAEPCFTKRGKNVSSHFDAVRKRLEDTTMNKKPIFKMQPATWLIIAATIVIAFLLLL